MKNHIKMGNQIYQTNKKFSALKESQKEKIAVWCYEAYRQHYIEKGSLPHGKGYDFVLDYVFGKTEEAKIWIPAMEVVRFYKGCKVKMSHRLQKEFPEVEELLPKKKSKNY